MTAGVLAGRLLDRLPDAAAAERMTPLFGTPGCRVERIVSAGQASPEGVWYDQPQTEFVLLLAGSARLRIEDEPAARDLAPGDYLVLPAHCRHRVEQTSAAPPAVWLAVHMG